MSLPLSVRVRLLKPLRQVISVSMPQLLVLLTLNLDLSPMPHLKRLVLRRLP